jgi:hypothetical protein
MPDVCERALRPPHAADCRPVGSTHAVKTTATGPGVCPALAHGSARAAEKTRPTAQASAATRACFSGCVPVPVASARGLAGLVLAVGLVVAHAQCAKDFDIDAVCSPGDNCPFVANPDQLDSDGDGEVASRGRVGRGVDAQRDSVGTYTCPQPCARADCCSPCTTRCVASRRWQRVRRVPITP